ncbi:hypothetical protein HOD20_07455 [archaeon]|jgi:hypothetical protein|nr:hypothetical protein [archaeon]MBT4352343.1 hypothetical protein [archaeon]MBT4646942.1 hypothetical protein [archaeon]MBT6821692.1 hypothetical protein [archaeon]MBT7392223.1 hypothetical protein [archaeon]
MKSKIKKLIRHNFKKILFYILGSIAVLVLITISSKMKAAVLITMFIALNIQIVSYKKFLPSVPIEIEILTLGIVLSTMVFGWRQGLIIAIIGGIFSFVFSGNFSPFAIPMLGGYILIVFTSYFLRSMNITFVGMISSIIANCFVFISYHILFRYDFAKNLSFSLSNLIVNSILFVNLAPFLFNLMN